MEAVLGQTLRNVAALFRRAGPYLLLELLLPGGTLFALLLYLFQRRSAVGAAPRLPNAASALPRALDRTHPAVAFAAARGLSIAGR